MDRKTKILSYMRSKEYIPLKFEELKAVLDVPREDASRLSDILAALIDEGKIYITKKGRYRSVGAGAQTASGILRCNANGRFGFVIGEEEAQDRKSVV